MKKTIICLILAVVMVLSIGTTAFAEENEITVVLDGVVLEFDQNPVIQNGRTLVPLRGIFEPMGAEVGWDDATQTVTAVKDGITIKLTIGDNILYKNGEAIILDVPAQLIGSRTMVPARAVSEAFDARVGWIEEMWTVTIVTDETMKNALGRIDSAEEFAIGFMVTYNTQGVEVETHTEYGYNEAKGLKYMTVDGYILPSDYEGADIISIAVTDGKKTFMDNNGEVSVSEGENESLEIDLGIINSLTLAEKIYEADEFAAYDDGMGATITLYKDSGEIIVEGSAADMGLENQIKEEFVTIEIMLNTGKALQYYNDYLAE